MSQPRAPLLIIGIGNEYRGDDGAGLIAARLLKARLGDSIPVLERSGDGAALIEAWRGAETVILIDAMMSGAAPGTIRRFDAITRPIPRESIRSSTHAFGVVQAIELARALGSLPLRLIVYGIEGKFFAARVGLSEEVEKAVNEAVERLLTELDIA
jgi:hydrogenase maturation protease